MIIIDPVVMGDVAFSRASEATYFDAAGVLQTAPPNTLRVTYDPADLSKAPYALVESEATNFIRNNTMQGAVAGTPGILPNAWAAALGGLSRQVVGKGVESGIDYLDIRFFGSAPTSNAIIEFEPANAVQSIPGQVWVGSVYAKLIAGSLTNVSTVRTRIREGLSDSTFVTDDTKVQALGDGALNRARFEHARVASAGAERITAQIIVYFSGAVDFTLRVGLPQLERDRITSPIKTSGAAATRAADVVGPGAGLVYSNVPITEQVYNAATTYAKDAVVYNPVTHLTHRSMIDTNKGGALDDPSKWAKGIATNRWKMFDELNNTQTTNPDEIVVVVTPEVISEGFYIGNVQADEIQLSQADVLEGPVLRETASLVESSGGSSYYDWCFRPPYYKDYFVTQSMLPYGGGLVTLILRRLGGVPKCGMCMVGPVDDFGPSLYGLSAEGTDYSSTVFEFDGTSETTFRPYAKRMSVDVQVDNTQIDYIQQRLFDRRQRMLVWLGGPYGATAVCGRYESFKIVIPGLLKSDMALQIGGGV